MGGHSSHGRVPRFQGSPRWKGRLLGSKRGVGGGEGVLVWSPLKLATAALKERCPSQNAGPHSAQTIPQYPCLDLDS